MTGEISANTQWCGAGTEPGVHNVTESRRRRRRRRVGKELTMSDSAVCFDSILKI